LGFLLSSALYGLFFSYIGCRGLLLIGVLPVLAVIWVRKYVREPEVWLENRRKQRAQRREMRVPQVAIFKRQLIGNTLTVCWWMASCMVTYYSIWGLFATHLQKDLARISHPTEVGTRVLMAEGFDGSACGHLGTLEICKRGRRTRFGSSCFASLLGEWR
jgi:SHS family lactate transporter-like MFS transporter